MAAVETPSKAAANALSSIDLNTPSKPTDATFLAKLKAAAAQEAAASKKPVELVVAEPVEEYRTRFVGDVECEEKDEPLLQETNSRFVLFPIKYREVSHLPNPRSCHTRHVPVPHLLPSSVPPSLPHDHALTLCRSGKCTSRLKPPSGHPRRSTSPPISTTGRTS